MTAETPTLEDGQTDGGPTPVMWLWLWIYLCAQSACHVRITSVM